MKKITQSPWVKGFFSKQFKNKLTYYWADYCNAQYKTHHKNSNTKLSPAQAIFLSVGGLLMVLSTGFILVYLFRAFFVYFASFGFIGADKTMSFSTMKIAAIIFALGMILMLVSTALKPGFKNQYACTANALLVYKEERLFEVPYSDIENISLIRQTDTIIVKTKNRKTHHLQGIRTVELVYTKLNELVGKQKSEI